MTFQTNIFSLFNALCHTSPQHPHHNSFHHAITLEVYVVTPVHIFFSLLDEQYILFRLANAAIDIYGMAAVLAR